MPLGVDYAAVAESDRPIVVQFTRMDTGSKVTAWAGSVAFAGAEPD
ncbi:sensory rhodopsin transducer [Rhodoligotrophos defluvii]